VLGVCAPREIGPREETVSAQSATSHRLLVGSGIVGVGLLVALAMDVALTSLTPAKTAFILGGFALLIPTLVVKDPRAYWLFLLVLSIPFDISKWLSDAQLTQTLVDTYGFPGSGTNSLEIYLSDVVLIAMLLPWLAGVCLRRERLYFPKIGYLFVFYLAWAMLVSLINAQVLYFTMFELCRQILYLLSFIYLINNVATHAQFRSVVWAIFLGFIIGSGTVIAFFEEGVGTETAAFNNLHDLPATSQQTRIHKLGQIHKLGHQDLTLSDDTGHHLGSMDHDSAVKRSQGMFFHPAIPASLCGLILPVVLAYLMTTPKIRDRILLFMVYAWGFVALLLTFSRAGLIGLMSGTIALFVVGSRSGLISRRALRLSGVVFIAAAALCIPLLVIYLKTRPAAFFMRFYLFDIALQGYAHHPILGVGFNNGTAAMQSGRQELMEMGIPITRAEAADSYYLAILIEVGPLGALLLFGFLGKIVMIGLQATRAVAAQMKPLLVGIIAGLVSLATQGIADTPMAGHAVSGMAWLFVALIIAIARQTQPDGGSSTANARARPPSSVAIAIGAKGDPA
jgi:O-antigen ligase/polysaccharide polymerase Wzy-like membrane protein